MAQWRRHVCHLRCGGDPGWDVILVLLRVGIEIDRDCECSNYRTTAVISHTSKVMLKILQLRFQKYVNRELPDVQAGFRKGREPEIKLPTSTGTSKKQDNSRETSTSALLTTPKLLTVWITTNCGIFLEMGIPDCLTGLLRNLYAGQEATVRTGHGTTDWFQIRKGVYC